MVIEVSTQIANGVSNIKLDNTVGTLRDRSVGWIVKAIHDISKKELIMKVRTYLTRFHIFNTETPKAFELCRVGNFKLSQQSLTSPEALAALRELPKSNPALYREFVGLDEPVEEPVGESEDEFSDDVEDASDIPVDVVSTLVTSGSTHLEEGFRIDDEGCVVRVAEVEDAEAGEEAVAEPEPVGRGHRKKKATVPWGGVAVWERHN